MFEGVWAYAARFLNPWILPAIGVCVGSFGVFLALELWIGRRRFNRRNFAGVEEFSSFGSSLRLRAGEGLVGVFASVFGFAFVLSGAIAVFGLAVAGYGAPAASTAGEPTLTQAQIALHQVAPAAYGKVADLASPGVSFASTSTTYSFHIAKHTASNAVSIKTYSVTLAPDGTLKSHTP